MPITPKPIEHRKGDKVKVAWPDGSVESVEYLQQINDYQVAVLRDPATMTEDEEPVVHVRKRWLFR